MWNDFANYKKVAFIIIIVFILSVLFVSRNDYNIAFAKEAETQGEIEKEFSDNLNNILDDIDANQLDDFLSNDFNLNFFDTSSFKSLAIKVLDGSYFDEYENLFSAIVDSFKYGFSELLKLLLIFLSLILLYEMFNQFCVDKFKDVKNIIRLIFSFVIILILLSLFKDISVSITEVVEKIFSFSKILFPILLNLILLSGAAGTHTVYSSMSLFLINTGSYIFTYVLLPIAVAIFVMTLFSSIISNQRFNKIIDLFKTIFKTVLIVFFTLFGLFSSINLFASGMKDGVSLRLTKFAIKNYIPIIGGYVSQGFDFVHSCSVVVKNAFGVCGIIVLFFIVLKPLILYFVYLLFFKVLSAMVSLFGSEAYSKMFENISKSMAYFIAVLIGLFFIIFVFIYLLIVSVSVV